MLKLNFRKDNSEKVGYNLANLPVYISKVFVESNYDAAIECHWHDDVEFVLVTLGELQYNINGICITLKEGQGVFVNAKQTHYGFTVGKNICECVTVIFHPKLISPNEHIENNCIAPVIGNNNFTHAVLSAETPWTLNVFESLIKAREIFEQSSGGFILELQSLFCDVWSALCTNMPEPGISEQTCYDMNSFKDMIAYIHGNCTDKITLSDISAAGGVCKSKCCGLFKQYLHQTPLGYLTVHRLRLAVKMLEDKTISMNEIAAGSGFGGASYFAEIFRKHYRCSPTEFRAL
jgi:AraC-like DNA-binding protein